MSRKFKPIVVKRSVILGTVAALAVSATTARAAAVEYSVSGVEGGLFGEPDGSSFSGGLVLDDNASQSVTTWGPV